MSYDNLGRRGWTPEYRSPSEGRLRAMAAQVARNPSCTDLGKAIRKLSNRDRARLVAAIPIPVGSHVL